MDVFSEDPVYSSRVSPSHQQSSPHKLVDLLEKTDEFLTTIFKVFTVGRVLIASWCNDCVLASQVKLQIQ